MSTRRTKDPRNAALAIPFAWPKGSDFDTFNSDFLTMISLGLGVFAIFTRNRLYSWGSVIASIVASANRKGDSTSSMNTTMFAVMSVAMSIMFDIQQYQMGLQSGGAPPQ